MNRQRVKVGLGSALAFVNFTARVLTAFLVIGLLIFQGADGDRYNPERSGSSLQSCAGWSNPSSSSLSSSVYSLPVHFFSGQSRTECLAISLVTAPSPTPTVTVTETTPGPTVTSTETVAPDYNPVTAEQMTELAEFVAIAAACVAFLLALISALLMGRK